MTLRECKCPGVWVGGHRPAAAFLCSGGDCRPPCPRRYSATIGRHIPGQLLRVASDLLSAIHMQSVAAVQHRAACVLPDLLCKAVFLTDGRDIADYALPFSFSPGIASHRLVEAMKTGFALRTHLGDPGSCTNASSCFLNLTSLLSDALSPEFASSLRCASPPLQAD